VCSDFGACTYRDNRCVASSDDDCKRSAFCERSGRCKAHGGSCVIGAESNADCRKGHGAASRSPCLLDGQCTAKDGVCVASSDADCQGSKACAEFAACTATDGQCKLLSEADCKRSEVCTKREMCIFKETRGQPLCVKAEQESPGHDGHGH
jgi:hypothetical protein